MSKLPATPLPYRKQPRRPMEAAWKALAALLALALHLPVLHWLRSYPRQHTTHAGPDTRVELRWLPRGTAAPLPLPASAATGASTGRQSSLALPAATLQAAATAAPVHGDAGAQVTTLDLSLPAHVLADAPIRPRNPMDPPAATAYRPTRFNQAWAPDGGPIQQTWAFRSKLAGALLGAIGALEKPCTEDERRQRLARCAGAQYQGDDDPPAITR